MGGRGYLLSVPYLVDMEKNQQYKKSLQSRLAKLHRNAQNLGMPHDGAPRGAFLDALHYESGVKDAVLAEFPRQPSMAFMAGLDPNHSNYAFDKLVSSALCDFQMGDQCHRDMMARTINPDKPGEKQEDLKPMSVSKQLVLDVRSICTLYLVHAKTWFRDNIEHNTARKERLEHFSQRHDALKHSLWHEVFPHMRSVESRRGMPRVPRVFLEHLARVVGVDLADTNLAWGYQTQVHYCHEVELFRCMFQQSVMVRALPSPIDGRREDVEDGVSTKKKTALVSSLVGEHLDRLKLPHRIQGLQNAKLLSLMCAEAGIHKASGTTDLDSICHELEVLLCPTQRNQISENLATVLLQIGFLRVHTRRSLKAAMPIIAHNNTKLGMLVLQFQQFMIGCSCPERIAALTSKWTNNQKGAPRQDV